MVEKFDELSTHIQESVKFTGTIASFVEEVAIDMEYPIEHLSSKHSKAENDAFRLSTYRYYGLVDGCVNSIPDQIICQLLNCRLPTRLTRVAHIFPRRFVGKRWTPGAGNIDNPRNTLVLFIPIERVFDRGQILFYWDHASELFRMYVLDPDLMEMSLGDVSTKYLKPDLLPLMVSIEGLKFKDLHQSPLVFPNGSFPLRRCVNFMAHRFRYEAIHKRNWLPRGSLSELDHQDAWSPGASERTDPILKQKIDQWRKHCALHSPVSEFE